MSQPEYSCFGPELIARSIHFLSRGLQQVNLCADALVFKVLSQILTDGEFMGLLATVIQREREIA
jgi:hypothetical protein